MTRLGQAVVTLPPRQTEVAMNADFDSQNPFAVNDPTGGNRFRSHAASMPTIVTVMAILSLIFCLIRIPLVAMGIMGYSELAALGHPMAMAAPWEILTGIGMVICGILGNILLLAKKRAGVAIGWGLMGCTIGSIAVGLWEASIMLGQFPDGSPQKVGGYIGAAITLVIRLALVVLYIIALNKASAFLNGHEQSPDQDIYGITR